LQIKHGDILSFSSMHQFGRMGGDGYDGFRLRPLPILRHHDCGLTDRLLIIDGEVIQRGESYRQVFCFLKTKRINAYAR